MYALIKELQLRTDTTGRFLQSWIETHRSLKLLVDPSLKLEELLNSAIEIRRPHLLAGDPSLLKLRLIAAALKQEHWQAEEAIEMLLPALDKLEQTGIHDGMAEGYRSLGEAYSKKEEYRAAIAAYNHAIAHAHAAPADDFLELELRCSLAGALLLSGDVVAADAAATDALRIAENRDNPYDSKAAGPLRSLAIIREAQGRMREAARLEFRSLELSFRALGIPIVDFAAFMTGRADKLVDPKRVERLRADGSFEKARVWLEKAIEIAAAHLESRSDDWKEVHPAEVELRANGILMVVCRLTGDKEGWTNTVSRIRFLAEHYGQHTKPGTFVSAVLTPCLAIIDTVTNNPPESQQEANMIISEVRSCVDLLEIARQKLEEHLEQLPLAGPGDAPEQIKAKANLRRGIDEGIARGRKLVEQLPDVKTLERDSRGAAPWVSLLVLLAFVILWIFFRR